MNRNKNYLSTILIIAAIMFSFYILIQKFIGEAAEGQTKDALHLIIPSLVLLIPVTIIVCTYVYKELQYRKIVKNGVKTVGFIEKLSETGKYVRKMPEIKLVLDILEDNGEKFIGEVITIVHPSEIEVLKKGQPVPVIYNINNKNNIVVDRKPEVHKLKEKISKYNS